MDGRLACQTDETPDARELYGLTVEDCGACRLDAAVRGAPVPLRDEDEAGEMISLAKAALGRGPRIDARPSVRPVAPAIAWRGPRK